MFTQFKTIAIALGTTAILSMGFMACNGEVKEPGAAECTSGAACLQAKNSDIRSCELLFSNGSSLKTPKVGFTEKVIGESMFHGTKLAVAFIVKDDAALSSDAPVVIRLAEGVKELKLDKSTCFDSKGNQLSGAEVSMSKP